MVPAVHGSIIFLIQAVLADDDDSDDSLGDEVFVPLPMPPSATAQLLCSNFHLTADDLW